MHNSHRFVVVDTNVLVSALLTPTGTAAKAIELVSSGKLTPCYDQQILSEYKTVLFRDKFNYDKLLVSQLLELIQDIGVQAPFKPSNIDLPDESDRKFYDMAKTAKAYLVTGNIKHFPQEDWILTPAEIVEVFIKQS